MTLTCRLGFCNEGRKPSIARERRSSSVTGKDKKSFAPFEQETWDARASKL